jgi:hypothetical protein
MFSVLLIAFFAFFNRFSHDSFQCVKASDPASKASQHTGWFSVDHLPTQRPPAVYEGDLQN